jgi:flagellar hook-length control protein FliK
MEAAFTLAPKHLGKVDVKVTIQDGQVTAEFLTSTPLGKDLLETHVQSLRSALETQGLLVGKIDISQQSTTASNFLGHFSQKGDSQTRQGQQDSRKRGEQPLHKAQDEYRDYAPETGWVSKINTTA